ncbi:MAG: hypothetical protein CMJ78_07025 [Planctomycetaceae bacterium]|nr:hypothetical protein [Planctomycetaceae bacterium]
MNEGLYAVWKEIQRESCESMIAASRALKDDNDSLSKVLEVRATKLREIADRVQVLFEAQPTPSG